MAPTARRGGAQNPMPWRGPPPGASLFRTLRLGVTDDLWLNCIESQLSGDRAKYLESLGASQSCPAILTTGTA